MEKLNAQRLVSLVLTLFFVLLAVFAVIAVIPGSATQVLAGEEGYARDVEKVSFLSGFVQYLVALLHFDLGVSLVCQRPVMSLILSHLAPSLSLAFCALFWCFLFSFLLSFLPLAHARLHSPLVSEGCELLLFSIPGFSIALFLSYFFAYRLPMFPVAGYVGLSGGLIPHLSSLFLPSLAEGLMHTALLSRMGRLAFLELRDTDFFRYALAKGSSYPMALIRHCSKGVVLQLLPTLGQSLLSLLAGSAVIESIFAIPGIGQLVVSAINSRDYPVLAGTVVLVSLFSIFLTLLVDSLSFLLDPRKKRKKGNTV